MSDGSIELVRTAFDAFLAGDREALSRVMAPDVEWLWHEPGDWDCHGRREVLETLFERQREGVVTGLDRVDPLDEDRVFVEVAGVAGGRVCTVVTVRDGLIVRMQDYADRDAARAGRPPGPAAEDHLLLRADDPVARRATEVIRTGDAAALQALLDEHPELAEARIRDPRRRHARTLLHVVTDWPGHVPDAAGKIAALAAAGADVNARFIGSHSETPLHWAASCDDVDALDALLDAGADIEAGGAVIGGGSAMADAVAFGQWQAARRLLERGAQTNLWQAAALGLVDRVRDELARSSPAREDLDNALWCAAHGGRRETAQLLLDRGGDPGWVGHDDLTPAAAAERSGAHELAAWLRERAAEKDPP